MPLCPILYGFLHPQVERESNEKGGATRGGCHLEHWKSCVKVLWQAKNGLLLVAKVGSKAHFPTEESKYKAFGVINFSICFLMFLQFLCNKK